MEPKERILGITLRHSLPYKDYIFMTMAAEIPEKARLSRKEFYDRQVKYIEDYDPFFYST